MKRKTLITAAFLVCFLWSAPAFALHADEVLVLANRNAPSSLRLASAYMKKRGIPRDHLLKLRVTDKEECTRKEYDRRIAGPVREYLTEKSQGRKIRCLLILYGLPLKIAAPGMDRDEGREYDRLRQREKDLKARLSALGDAQDREREEIGKELAGVKDQRERMAKSDQRASLDSEISLVLQENHPLGGWIPNPYFVGYRQPQLIEQRDATLFVSRLDGPSPEIVRRVIHDSLEAERAGLDGKAYFDARWPRTNERADVKGQSGYHYYDTSIYRAADAVKASRRLAVVVNDKPELFQPGECPDAALYCGWYQLGRYVDAFAWTRGSVGYHIASAECQTLKRPGSQVWCKRMLEKGIAATLGPVHEPYVQAFPVPELFFRFLLDGYWTLAECYALSQPFLSWQMVLIGDPLYRPFKAR